jgi:hypothetical protein
MPHPHGNSIQPQSNKSAIQTPPDKKCYNCEEKGHFAITCSNPHSRPPLSPSTKAASNHKGGSTSIKVTTTYFNCGQVGHFANQCPDRIYNQLQPARRAMIVEREVALPFNAATHINHSLLHQ